MSPRLRRALLAGGLAIVAGSTALEALVHDPHHDEPGWTMYWYHHFPGWNAVLGFCGCVLIIVVSKALGKVWLQRKEGFYDE
jgi:hypothetical protein